MIFSDEIDLKFKTIKLEKIFYNIIYIRIIKFDIKIIIRYDS